MIVYEKKIENSPSGGALVGKRKGQTMIHNKGSMSGYLVGKTHAEGGIKAINKSTGQPLEMQGGEVVITAPAVSDQTKRKFEGKMMTNREILSAINEKGGGVSFAQGGELPSEMHFSGASYKYGGKMLSDHDIAYELSKCGCDHEMKDGDEYEIGGIFHGSPYSFDKFTTETMGTGSGKQIDGWGIYLTNSKDSSKIYGKNIYETTLFKGKDLSEYTFIDLDKPVKKDIVTKIVKAVYKKYGKDFDVNKFNKYYDYTKDNSLQKLDFNDYELIQFDYFGFLFYKTLSRILGGDKKASLFLLDNGIDGLKRNISKTRIDYVIFDAKDITVEKKENYAIGGKLIKDNLSKDSKSGNTPARDLNNYNDMMDVGVDGQVGGESGMDFANGGDLSFLDNIDNVFYQGGTVGNDKVTIAKIVSQSSTYSALNGRTFNTFQELKKAIREEFNNQNKRFGHFYFEVNGIAPRFGIQMKDGKNTVLNFNPNTGDADDFEKQLLRRGSYSYKKFDWNDWYSGRVSASASTASVSHPVPSQQQKTDIFSLTQKLQIDELPDTNFGINNNLITNLPDNIQGLVRTREFEQKGSIGATSVQGAFNWGNTIEGADFWNDVSIGKFKEFKKRYGSGVSASTANVPQQRTNNIFTPSEILEIDRLAEGNYGVDNNMINNLPSVIRKLSKLREFEIRGSTSANTLSGSFGWNDAIEGGAFWGDIAGGNFKEFKKRYGSGASGSTASASTASVPQITFEDLAESQIWVGDNAELSKAVQQKAFDLGFKWGGDESGNPQIQVIKQKTLRFWDDGEISTRDFKTKDEFDRSTSLKQLTPADLGIDVNNLGATQQMPIDLNTIPKSRMKVLFEIKKFVDDNNLTPNPAVVETLPNKIDFVDEETGDVFEFSTDNKLLNPKTKIASDLLFEFLDFEKGFSDFANKKINELSDGLADLNQLAVEEVKTMEKEQKDLEALKKLLPAFQESKFSNERAMILKEMSRLNKKITYEGFIALNEKYSEANQLFTPQGLLKYYYTQTTQSPVAPIEPACELPTPNGGKSKLPLSTYFNVRTSRFKKWFGDWEKAYETNNYVNCSKMIDEETKEPKIFYHGVRKYVPNFGQFSNMGQGVVRPYGSFEPPTAFPASYFSDSEEYAKFYAGEAPNMPKPTEGYEGFIYKVFINVKNPINMLPLGFESSYKDMIDYLLVAYGVRVQPSRSVLDRIQNDMKKKHPLWVYVRNDVALLEMLKEYGYDGIIQIGDIPTFDKNGDVIEDRSKFIQDEEYLTFYPTQVKSATVKKSFYFDFFNDVRFKQGGYVRI